MASRRLLDGTLFRPSALALSLTLTLACGSGGDDDPASTPGGASTSAGQSTAGGQGNAGGQTATAGQSNNTGGQTVTAGQGNAGGQTATAGQSNNMGGQLAGEGGTAGAPSGGTSAGASPSGGTESGGPSSGGSEGTATGGTAGSGGAPSGECTRALLDGILDAYLAAQSAGDPSSLPLAPNVKFTENAQVTELGTTDFWKNAGDAKHSQRALDTEQCSVGAQAVVPEGTRDLPIAIRIKVAGGQMTEIETIVVRPGDYTASFAVASNPAAIINIAGDIGWHDEVPEGQRATREQLTSWINKYFRAFPSGVCNVTSACRRLENGGGNFSCGTGASCNQNTPSQGGTFIPRVILADEVRGIAVGLTNFDYQTTGHLDMHMIKMSGGQVHAVQAILRNTNGESGWD